MPGELWRPVFGFLTTLCVGLPLFHIAKRMKAKRAKSSSCPKCGGPVAGQQFGASLNCQECGERVPGVAICEGAIGCCGIGLLVLFGFGLIGWAFWLINHLLERG